MDQIAREATRQLLTFLENINTTLQRLKQNDDRKTILETCQTIIETTIDLQQEFDKQKIPSNPSWFRKTLDIDVPEFHIEQLQSVVEFAQEHPEFNLGFVRGILLRKLQIGPILKKAIRVLNKQLKN